MNIFFKSWVHVSVGISMLTACSVTHKLFMILAAPHYVSAWTIKRPFKFGL